MVFTYAILQRTRSVVGECDVSARRAARFKIDRAIWDHINSCHQRNCSWRGLSHTPVFSGCRVFSCVHYRREHPGS